MTGLKKLKTGKTLKTKKDLNLPRAPLMKLTGSIHKNKKKVLPRKAKYRKLEE